MATLSIGQLAEAAGVHVETVRYYERRGLLAEPPRTAAGYRQYSSAEVWRLQFIARAKRLGFTLAEIRDLLDAGPEHTEARTLAAARAKLSRVEEQLRELTETKARLGRLVDLCAGGASADCAALNLSG
jgi:MerR family mercuric resistance operon transcriptional regulator